MSRHHPTLRKTEREAAARARREAARLEAIERQRQAPPRPDPEHKETR
jgi:hypothetical protein